MLIRKFKLRKIQVRKRRKTGLNHSFPLTVTLFFVFPVKSVAKKEDIFRLERYWRRIWFFHSPASYANDKWLTVTYIGQTKR